MRHNIIYFGSKTSSFSGTTSTMETLEPLLSEFCDVKTFSHIQNRFLRMAHMTYGYLRYSLKSDIIIIDVYSTGAFYYAEWLSLLSRNVGNKKILLVLHGGNLPELYNRNQQRVKNLFDKATTIIAPSHYLKFFFEKKGFLLRLIPNIIELKNYPFLERFKARPKILALRGFKKTYNPLMSVKAIHSLITKGMNVELLMLGNKNEDCYSEVVTYINNHKLDEFVVIKPKQDKKVWIAMSRDYDIMLSNPKIDNTPVSIIEGMALGMCVITTAVGGVPFIFKDNQNSLFVENNDVQSLAETIKMLLKNDQLANRLSKQGRLLAQQYDWSKVQDFWKSVIMDK